MGTQFLCQGHRDGIIEQLRNVQYILREDCAAAGPRLSCSEGEEERVARIGCCLGVDAASSHLDIVLARGFLCRDEAVEETLAVARKRVAPLL